MPQKQIEDGADSIILTELDDAAEARIIDVLSRVFVTGKYPELKSAIVTAITKYQKVEEDIRCKQVAYAQQQAMQDYHRNTYGQSIGVSTGTSPDQIRKALDKPFRNW